MTNIKYNILLHVRNGTVLNPARRRDFYHRIGRVNEYHHCINELISQGLLEEVPGDDILTIKFPKGLDALEQEQERRERDHLEHTRYWITTSIAAFSLIISFVSVLIHFLCG